MSDLIRGEIRKILTTRTGLGIVAGAALVVALGTLSTVMSVGAGQLTGPIHDQMFYFLASIILGGFALILGIRSFTDEYRHGTIVSTFLTSTDRIRVLGAKTIVSALAAVVMTLGSLMVMIALASAFAGVKDSAVSVTATDVRAFAGLIAGTAGWAAIGTAVGAIVRHQVAAIVGGLIWVLVVENMASGFVPELSRFTPGQAAHALAEVTRASNLTSIPVAAVTIGAYLLVGAVTAAWTLQRRDLT
ncbi:MAG TPA: ABC transporter permease subunit [Acidimicrobiia bacterium]|nr:ABC transporter permease subunit [Acidimicrobiia bacterium]